MNRILTIKKKREYLFRLIRRDGGFKCFYCKRDLSSLDWIYEHLNDNPSHNNIDNIVLACQSCNVKKKNSFDLQILAQEKLKRNQESNLLCEREDVEPSESALSPEMEASQKNFDIVKQYLTEIIETDGFIRKKDAIYSSSMLCKKKTGTGSPVSVTRYVQMLTSKEGPFEETKNKNKEKILVKREI